MSFTAAEFRESERMSRSREHELESQRLAPGWHYNGTRKILSPEAAQNWRLMMRVLTEVCELSEGDEANIRALVQEILGEPIPDQPWRQAWAAAPAERARRSKRAASRRATIQKRRHARANQAEAVA